MKFYTKEWYDVMQHLHYTCGVKKIPDKEYSDKEIRELYYLALKKKVGTGRSVGVQLPVSVQGDLPHRVRLRGTYAIVGR